MSPSLPHVWIPTRKGPCYRESLHVDRPPDAYAALRHAFVRSFAIGRFAAIAGWQMISVAVGWQLYERTGDPWALGLVGAVELAPVLFLIDRKSVV